MSGRLGGQAEFHPSGDVDLTFTYSADIVAELKAVIPPFARSYNGQTRTWTVAAGFAWLGVNILKKWFGTAGVAVIDHKPPTPIRQSDPHYSTLYVMPNAPACVVEAAYRALAKEHHPDRGGSTATMQRINDAYDAISRKRGVA